MNLRQLVWLVWIILAVSGLWCEGLSIVPQIAVDNQMDGTVVFRVRTLTPEGHYTPRSIGAIWITDEHEQFIKTLKYWDDGYLEYLTQKPAPSTSQLFLSTAKGQHFLHNLTWDGTNSAGIGVPDGTYKIYMEFSEDNGKNPWYAIVFTKSTLPDSAEVVEQDPFTDMQLAYSPEEGTSLTQFDVTKDSETSVLLKWTTAYETDMVKFNLYRGSTTAFKNARKLTRKGISVTNTYTAHDYQYTDENLTTGRVYYYWLEAVGLSGSIETHGPMSVRLPAREAPIEPVAAPNVTRTAIKSFISATGIEFSVKTGERAHLFVYNILGNTVRDFGYYSGGDYRVTWDGKNQQGRAVSSGVYFYVLKSGSGSQVKRMTLMK